MKITVSAAVHLWVSLDGGILFLPYTAPCKVTIQIKGRLMPPDLEWISHSALSGT